MTRTPNNSRLLSCKHWLAKLTPEQVYRIRVRGQRRAELKKLLRELYSNEALAKEFDVSPTCISETINGVRYPLEAGPIKGHDYD